MTKLIIYLTKIIIATVLALLFTSCQYSFDIGDGIKGTGNVQTESRTVDGTFNSIDVSRGIIVEITISDTKSIIVEADKNLLEHISTDISDGVLTISSDKNINFYNQLKVKVSMLEVVSLNASSGAEIVGLSSFKTQQIDFRTSSAGEIEAEVEAEKVSCKSSSGSQITIKGKALELETSSSSGSEIDASELYVNDVIAKASSGSSIDVYPFNNLEAKASSGSDIIYFHNPKTISKKESSGGSVNKN